MSMMEKAMRRAAGGELDKPVAGFAALSVGAAMFMVPIALIESVMVRTGLASMVSALAPPLGMKARIGLALLAGGLVFALVLMLMRALGRASDMFEPEAAADAAPVPATPRARRRDRHPDAPTRAPISVARDLGAPLELEPEPGFKARAEEAPQRGRFAQIMGGDAEGGEAPPTDETLSRIREYAAEEPVAVPEPEPEPVEVELDLSESAFEAEPEPTPEIETDPLPPFDAVQEARPTIRPGWLEAPAPVPAAPKPASGDESLAVLMERFERALERRQRKVVPAPAQATRVEEEAPETDTRLRSALENLKRFAPRAG